MCRVFHLLIGLLVLCQVACAGPGAKLFPPVAVKVDDLSDGRSARVYDTDADGRGDYAEELSPEGRVVRLRYDLDAGQDDTVVLNEIAAGDCRHLVLILDSIPYAMVRDLWQQGRFRLFCPPVRVISPFPVMTDVCLAEFFGVSPCPGIESEYFDGRRLTHGYFTYANEVNTPWLKFVDYHLNPIAHGVAYPNPLPWYDHELRRIQDQFNESDRDCFVGYCVGPSALGAKHGRTGHQVGLVRLDRFCQAVMHATRGRVQITLMSDHGHNLVRSERIGLLQFLRDCGYRVAKELKRPGDVVVPEFGVVTCAVIHTQEAASVARDLCGADGVELVAYRQGEEVVVLSREGRATISKRGNRYRYFSQWGDPLRLRRILDQLETEGCVDADGFAENGSLFNATSDHDYPDVVHRLWRSFHGLVENTPDVLVSIEDGRHCGSAFMSKVLDLSAAHGNLNRLSSTAFVMTTAGELAPVLRMEELHGALSELGARLPSSR